MTFWENLEQLLRVNCLFLQKCSSNCQRGAPSHCCCSLSPEKINNLLLPSLYSEGELLGESRSRSVFSPLRKKRNYTVVSPHLRDEERRKQERDILSLICGVCFVSDLTLTGMSSEFRLTHIQRKAKVLSWCTHFEEKFTPFKEKIFLNAPLLKKEFLWLHPFWKKVFSGYTPFEEHFSLDAPFLSVHGIYENSPPKSPNNNNNKFNKKNNTFLSLICRLRRR